MLQVPMAERITTLLAQQPADPATEAAESTALQALQASAALLAARKAAKTASQASKCDQKDAANTSENRSTQNGGLKVPTPQNGAAALSQGLLSTTKGAKAQQPLDPEFENTLSLRVAAVMHRGLQLACGLGALGGSDDEGVEDPSQNQPTHDPSAGAQRPQHVSNARDSSLQDGARAHTAPDQQAVAYGHSSGNPLVGGQKQVTSMHASEHECVAGPSSGAGSAAHAHTASELLPQAKVATGPPAAPHISTGNALTSALQELPVQSHSTCSFRGARTAVPGNDVHGKAGTSVSAGVMKNSTSKQIGEVPGAVPMHTGSGVTLEAAAAPMDATNTAQPGDSLHAQQEDAAAVDADDDSDALPEIDSGPSEDDDEDS